MSFQQGLSGLNATSKNLQVIGNNIANANTFGSKSTDARTSQLAVDMKVLIEQIREQVQNLE